MHIHRRYTEDTVDKVDEYISDLIYFSSILHIYTHYLDVIWIKLFSFVIWGVDINL